MPSSVLSGSQRALLVTTAALAGGGIAQAWSLVSTKSSGASLPQSSLFNQVFWYFWLPLAVLAAAAGLVGVYRAISQRPPAAYLWAFVVLFCLVVRADGQELGWSFVRLVLFVGGERIQVGVNIFGLALAGWLSSARFPLNTPSEVT
jgi:hypothetical protein